MKKPLNINIASIRGNTGATQDLHVSAQLEDLVTSAASVSAQDSINFDGVAQASEGKVIVVRGHMRAPWSGQCRRCLMAAKGSLDVDVKEIFEASPTEGETYAISGDYIDLQSMLRETIMVNLPLAPLCNQDCAGLCSICGANKNENDCNCSRNEIDPRWSGLDALKES